MSTEYPITSNAITVLVWYEKKKKAYYNNLNICDVTDNKTFWRKVKLVSEKVNLQTKLLLVEKGNYLSDPEISSEIEKVISEDMEIAETFNEFFVNIVPSLKISPKENYETDVGNDNAANLKLY